MPVFQEYDEVAGGVLVRRIVTNDDGEIIEEWSQAEIAPS